MTINPAPSNDQNNRKMSMQTVQWAVETALADTPELRHVIIDSRAIKTPFSVTRVGRVMRVLVNRALVDLSYGTLNGLRTQFALAADEFDEELWEMDTCSVNSNTAATAEADLPAQPTGPVVVPQGQTLMVPRQRVTAAASVNA